MIKSGLGLIKWLIVERLLGRSLKEVESEIEDLKSGCGHVDLLKIRNHYFQFSRIQSERLESLLISLNLIVTARSKP